MAEAKAAGEAIKTAGLEFDVAYTSVLKRAIKTCWIALEECDQMYLPIKNEWRLNERHYGALSGLNKAETAAKHGEEQVKIWRRSYDIPPPALDESHEYFPGNSKIYAHVPKEQLPRTESLKLTLERVLPCWHEVIAPDIKAGQRVLIVAHGNSLRALIKELDQISDENIIGVPLVYHLDDNLKPIPQQGSAPGLSGKYLGNPDEIAARAAAVEKQGKSA